MKYPGILFLLLVGSVCTSNAQSTHDFMVSAAFDVIKTDNEKVFGKAQMGVEAHYFIQRTFAAGAGFEVWTQQKNSFMLGIRWYPVDNLFFRFRGLIGVNDATVGFGWSKALNTTWRFEAVGDFYFNSQFAVRTGISYIIK